MIGPQLPPAAPVVYSEALIDKLRAGAFEGRRKAVETQRIDEQKLFPLMWSRMSTGSKSKVREEPGFEACRLRLDSVQLWEFVRRSHLAHAYGEDDSMRAVNVHEQTLRYNYLRQGARDVIGEFKTRFDNQVLANRGVGIAEVEEPIRAIDFLSKLDTGMLTYMRNNAVQNLPPFHHSRSLQGSVILDQHRRGSPHRRRATFRILDRHSTRDKRKNPKKRLEGQESCPEEEINICDFFCLWKDWTLHKGLRKNANTGSTLFSQRQKISQTKTTTASRRHSSRRMKSPCSREATCSWTTKPRSTSSATRAFSRTYGNRRMRSSSTESSLGRLASESTKKVTSAR